MLQAAPDLGRWDRFRRDAHLGGSLLLVESGHALPQRDDIAVADEGCGRALAFV
jgi:hypothetical protein